MEAEAPSAWVLLAEPEVARRAARVAERRADVLRSLEVPGGWCVELRGGDAALATRLERRLGTPVERRLDCDVARFPLGRGWVVAVLEPPADTLAEALDTLGWTFRDVARPSDPAAPVTVCTPTAGVADPTGVDEALREAGLVVRGVWEVGGCTR